jgi:hypothetical protein
MIMSGKEDCLQNGWQLPEKKMLKTLGRSWKTSWSTLKDPRMSLNAFHWSNKSLGPSQAQQGRSKSSLHNGRSSWVFPFVLCFDWQQIINYKEVEWFRWPTLVLWPRFQGLGSPPPEHWTLWESSSLKENQRNVARRQ